MTVVILVFVACGIFMLSAMLSVILQCGGPPSARKRRRQARRQYAYADRKVRYIYRRAETMMHAVSAERGRPRTTFDLGSWKDW